MLTKMSCAILHVSHQVTKGWNVIAKYFAFPFYRIIKPNTATYIRLLFGRSFSLPPSTKFYLSRVFFSLIYLNIKKLKAVKYFCYWRPIHTLSLSHAKLSSTKVLKLNYVQKPISYVIMFRS